MAALEITPAAPEDLDAVEELDALAFGEPVPGSATRRAQLEEELVRPWALLRVARDPASGASVVGFALAWHVVDELHVLNVAVSASRRRGGVGTALLRALFAEARAAGVTRCLLEVRRSNDAALALYGSLGFTVFHERRAYYPDGEDAIELELRLA